jgi:hypothetical protein
VAADRSAEDGVLLDAEWRFGVAVSTDDVGRVGSTFVQLRMLVGDADSAGSAGSSGPQEHFLELSVPQFYSLLGNLEKAKQFMEVLGRV